VTQRGKEGYCTDGRDERGKEGNRTGGTQEFSPSPSFHPGLQRIVSDTRAYKHARHTHTCSRVFRLVTHEWYSHILSKIEKRSLYIYTHTHARARITSFEYPCESYSMPMHI